jgi:hypothetical protein
VGRAFRRRLGRAMRLSQGPLRRFLADCANRMPKLLGDRDTATAQRVMQAMLQMSKLDIARLEAAHAGQLSGATTTGEPQ